MTNEVQGQAGAASGGAEACNHGIIGTMPGPNHGLIPRCFKCYESFVPASKLRQATKERDHWKANHDEQARQRRADHATVALAVEALREAADLEAKMPVEVHTHGMHKTFGRIRDALARIEAARGEATQ